MIRDALKKTYQGKRVLITGDTGFKGAWLCQWLTLLGANVMGLANQVPTEPSLFNILKLSENIHHDFVDVRHAEALRYCIEKHRPEIIFHLAAQSLVGKGFKEPKLTFETNINGIVNLLESVRKQNAVKAVVVITSDKCYENLDNDHAFIESDKLNGSEPYSASKACAEIVTHAYIESYFKHSQTFIATARAGNVIGGGDFNSERLIPDCMNAWAHDQTFFMRNPNSTRPWQHVLEPLYGYLLLGAELLNKNTSIHCQSFNFAPEPSDSFRVIDVLEIMQSFWVGKEIAFDKNHIQNFKEARYLRLNSEKAKILLGWRTCLDLHTTVEMTVSWYKNYFTNNAIQNFTEEQIFNYETILTDHFI